MATSPPLFQLQVDVGAADGAQAHGDRLGERPRADAANRDRAAVLFVLGDVEVGRLDPVVDRRVGPASTSSSRAATSASAACSAAHSRSGDGACRQTIEQRVERRRTELLAQLADARRARAGALSVEGRDLGVQRIGLLGAREERADEGDLRRALEAVDDGEDVEQVDPVVDAAALRLDASM